MSQVTDKLYHIMFIEYTSPWTGFELTTSVVIGNDYTGVITDILLKVALGTINQPPTNQKYILNYTFCILSCISK
jgi:hypothetical protein